MIIVYILVCACDMCILRSSLEVFEYLVVKARSNMIFKNQQTQQTVIYAMHSSTKINLTEKYVSYFLHYCICLPHLIAVPGSSEFTTTGYPYISHFFPDHGIFPSNPTQQSGEKTGGAGCPNRAGNQDAGGPEWRSKAWPSMSKIYKKSWDQLPW